MRISRLCYDKPHRCPGWAGGGMHYAEVDRCGWHGRVDVYPLDSDGYGHPAAGWRAFWFGACDSCGVRTLPWFTRKFSIPWWIGRFKSWWRYR